MGKALHKIRAMQHARDKQGFELQAISAGPGQRYSHGIISFNMLSTGFNIAHPGRLPAFCCFTTVPVATIGPLILLLLCIFSNVAQATADKARGSTAADLSHPELVPQGISGEGFTFYPDVSYSLSYDDNVFATRSFKQSSFLSVISPSLAVNSTWSRNELNFNAGVSNGYNHDFPSEDYQDWLIGTDGKLDIRHDIKLSGGINRSHQHVDRTAPDNTRGVVPTEFDEDKAFARYRQTFGRISASVKLEVVEKEFYDVDAIRLGMPVTIDNSVRDRTIYNLSLRGAYQYVGNEQVFVSIKGNDRNYDKISPLTGQDKSSTGLEAVIGASFDRSGILLGEISVGYRYQDYQDPLPDIEAPLYGASLYWNIGDLTTTHFIVDQSVRESISQFFSGYLSTTTSIGVDHELQRNLVLNMTLLYTKDKYEAIEPANRRDDTYSLILGSTYKMNRNFYFTAEYTYLERESDLSFGPLQSARYDFDKNLISFQVLAQF